MEDQNVEEKQAYLTPRASLEIYVSEPQKMISGVTLNDVVVEDSAVLFVAHKQSSRFTRFIGLEKIINSEYDFRRFRKVFLQKCFLYSLLGFCLLYMSVFHLTGFDQSADLQTVEKRSFF